MPTLQFSHKHMIEKKNVNWVIQWIAHLMNLANIFTKARFCFGGKSSEMNSVSRFSSLKTLSSAFIFPNCWVEFFFIRIFWTSDNWIVLIFFQIQIRFLVHNQFQFKFR